MSVKDYARVYGEEWGEFMHRSDRMSYHFCLKQINGGHCEKSPGHDGPCRKGKGAGMKRVVPANYHAVVIQSG